MDAKKFKVGDKVRVRSLDWYNKEKNENGEIVKGKIFVEEMSQFCNKILTIKDIYVDFYIVEENSKSWQDWMLENEIVKDIKKRILTKEVAQAVVRCTKYCLKNEEENANLQKKLFEIGCKWISGCEEVQNEECKYLFVSVNLNTTTSSSEEIFIKNKFTEVNVNDVLNIEIKDTSMEIKEMTQKEVFAYLKDTKILCTSKEESIKVQVALFAFGIEWISKMKGIDEDKYLLFINNKLEIQHTSDIDFWMDDVNKRIEPNDILSITLKEKQKPKFDPKTLQDFQKVLYRSSNADWWRLGFFEHYNIQNNNFWIIGQDVQPYQQCVPYNDETEHLKGQSLDAPDYYKNW